MDLVKTYALNSKGEAIAEINGLKIFIPFAGKDETLLVSTVSKKKNFAKGALKKVITPSKDRCFAPCCYYTHCGGCQLMHLSAEAQTLFKKQKVTEALQKIAKIKAPDFQVISSKHLFYYRNKIELSHKKGALGLYSCSHTVFSLESPCLIAHPQLSKAINILQSFPIDSQITRVTLRYSFSMDQVFILLWTSNLKKQNFLSLELLKHPLIAGVAQKTPKQLVHLKGSRCLEEKICGYTYQVAPLAFTQVNLYQSERLYQHLFSLVQSLKPLNLIIDAYCGIGVVSTLLAPHCKQLIGIEISKEAVFNAQQNAKRLNIENIIFYAGACELFIDQFKKADLILLNPPRSGCSQLIIQALLETLPSTIIYVSCNPSTLSRDLYDLFPFYQLDHVCCFDLFPQTNHIETLIKLTKK